MRSLPNLLRLLPALIGGAGGLMMQVGPGEAQTNFCHWVRLAVPSTTDQCLHGIPSNALYFVFGATFVLGLVWFLWPLWQRPLASPPQPLKPELQYLGATDTDLGWAIRAMAQKSAWGRWFAAQHLATSGKPIDEHHLLHIASTVVMDSILDGDIEVRGRKPTRMEYEPIPRTDWRSSAFVFLQDSICLWRMHIIPRGGAQISPDGTFIADNAACDERNANLRAYDSLIVDAHQFENRWPSTDKVADQKRQKFLRTARKRNLDPTTIRMLS
jgi:hypothetical protein